MLRPRFLAISAITLLISAVAIGQGGTSADQFVMSLQGKPIPYPYSALLDQMIRENSIHSVGADSTDPENDSLKTLQTARIPDGRSLARKAASFSSPRYVSVITNFTRSID